MHCHLRISKFLPSCVLIRLKIELFSGKDTNFDAGVFYQGNSMAMNTYYQNEMENIGIYGKRYQEINQYICSTVRKIANKSFEYAK